MARSRRGEADDRERVEERRRQILDAASLVFAKRGYHLARTREIAAEAGVAEGTIYNYFKNKRDMLMAIIHRLTVESIPETLTQTEAYQDARSWLAAVLNDRLAMLDRNRELIKAVLPEMITHTELHDGYLRQVIIPSVIRYLPLTQRIFKKTPLRPYNPRVIVPAIIGATVTSFLFIEWADLPIGEPLNRAELVDELVAFILGGILSRDQTSGASGEQQPPSLYPSTQFNQAHDRDPAR